MNTTTTPAVITCRKVGPFTVLDRPHTTTRGFDGLLGPGDRVVTYADPGSDRVVTVVTDGKTWKVAGWRLSRFGLARFPRWVPTGDTTVIPEDTGSLPTVVAAAVLDIGDRVTR